MLVRMSEEPDDYEGKWPEGDAMTEWVMVPREPTGDMISAGWQWQAMASIWKAMIEAAPAAPQVVVHHETPPIVSDIPLKFTAAPQQAEPALTVEVAQDADGAWSLTVPTYFPCMPVGKHDLYLHPPADEAQRLIDKVKAVLDDATKGGRVYLVGASAIVALRAALDALEGK